MNCTRMESLLPLYVAGDLRPNEAARVAAHLDQCSPCRERAAEFEASRAWLCASATPEFDESFFAELRGSVWSEIAREPERSKPFFASLFRWKPLLAAAAMLTLAFGGWLFSRDTAKPRPRVPQDELAVKKEAAASHQSPAAKREEPKGRTQPTSSKARPTQPRTAARPELKPQPIELPAAKEPVAPLVAAGESAAEAPAEAAAPETLRIEIQTADPNIRIIWFAPKEAAKSTTESR